MRYTGNARFGMQLESFLSKNPKVGLLKCLGLSLLLAGFLYGSFSLERPSILIAISAMIAIALGMCLARYYDMVNQNTVLHLFLDERDVLISDPILVFIPEKGHHVLRLVRTWRGFRINAIGPNALFLENNTMLNPFAIRQSLLIVDNRKPYNQVVAVRDYAKKEKKKVDKNLN